MHPFNPLEFPLVSLAACFHRNGIFELGLVGPQMLTLADIFSLSHSKEQVAELQMA